MGRGNFESASFSFNGDAKVGVYTSSATSTHGAGIAFAQTNLQANSRYPGFELQYVYSSTVASNAMRINYTERSSAGAVQNYTANVLAVHDALFIKVTEAKMKGANVTSVAGNSSNINTVAGISANVTTVAGISANVTTVAGISANVTSVAGNSTNINAVAGNSTNINAVNANSTNINTVAGVNAAVTTVATNISSVNTAATNIAAIIDAPNQATAAANSATAAAASAAAGMYSAVQDKSAGQITLNGASLANITNVSFTLNNSTISAKDVIILSVSSGATAGAYNCWISSKTTGSCVITIRNLSGGSLSEAFVLNFAVIHVQ